MGAINLIPYPAIYQKLSLTCFCFDNTCILTVSKNVTKKVFPELVTTNKSCWK